MKKFLAALLALSLTFGSVALPAAESGVIARGVNISASAETYGDFEYDFLYDGTIEITKYTGNGGNVVIPSTINGKRVTRIGNEAFIGKFGFDSETQKESYESNITSITIPNGVTSIGYAAFQGCSSLININMPDSVTSIGSSAFEACSVLKSITIPNGVSNIEQGTFYGCTNLENITIPNGVTKIGEHAFNNCISITNITIPNSVTNIEYGAFYSCINLENITIPDSITYIGTGAFSKCSSLTNVIIPDGVTNIYHYTFQGCSSLTSITVPNSVTNIYEGAFSDCSSLKNVTIGNGVTNIEDYVFNKCTDLTNITVDPNNKYYSSENGVLFTKDKSDLLIYPAGNSRKEYSIPNGVRSIHQNAFCDCSNLTSITMSNSVASIGKYAFFSCSNLLSVIMSDSITSIGEYAFSQCESLTSITIPNGVTSISDCTFYLCTSLKNITIPDSVTNIGRYTFYLCSSLKKIMIPKSVASIDDYAFQGCRTYSDFDVYYTGSENDWDNIKRGYSIFDEQSNVKLHYNFDPNHKHSYTSTITEQPTCTEEGIKTFKCDCGDTYTETIPAKGHTIVTDKAVAATCTTNGKTEGSHCSVCGEVIKAQTVIKATGHKYDNGKITKQPTCTETGVKTFTCSKCGDTKTETIKATGHKSGNWIVDKPAAIGVKGSKHKECTVCGKVLETAEIPALSKQNIQSATITLSKSTYVYDGKVKKPSVTVKLGSKTLKNGTDYTVSYSNNVKVGTATVKITGKGDYTGSVTKNFSIKNDFLQATVTGISTKTYSGKSQTQKITVKFGGKTLKNGTDYTVSYSNNKKIGTASMKIVGKGDYAGTIERSFKINPVKLSISKLTAKSKGFKASWAKNDQATGYEMQYSTDSKFKTAKKVAITKKTTTAKTITKLKASKKYYVRMRIYTTVNGTKYYGAWSAVKTVTTKK